MLCVIVTVRKQFMKKEVNESYWSSHRRCFESILAAFSRKSSFATVVRFFNVIDSCPCFSLDLNV